MSNKYLKLFLPHLISFVVLAIAALVYFAPAAFEGKVLQQSDVIQAKGGQAETIKFREKEGREILWTNSMFGGMPTYQTTGVSGNNYNFLGQAVTRIFRLNTPLTSPYGLVFAAFLGFYILLVTMKTDWRLAVFGALAFGLSTSNMILIEAGHLNKVLTLVYLAPTLAGIWLIFKGRYLLGMSITALFTCMQIASNHIQITYYFFLIIGLWVLFQGIEAIREGNMTHWIKSILALGLAAVIGVLPNTTQLWTTYEYSAETIRGKSDLVEAGKNQPNDGLTKQYAFDWSQGKMETFSLLIPNFMGANSGESFLSDPNSESLRVLRTMNPEQAEALQQATTHYWGDQPFTSGAQYYGAILFLLFCLGCFLIEGALRWWAVASLTLILMISWGKNFAVLNYLLFDYFPLFNKFRAVNMVLALGHLVIVAVGILGLQRFLDGNIADATRRKALYGAVGVAGGLCAFALLYSYISTLAAPIDSQLNDLPQFLNALRADRASLLRSDALRSLGFILAATAMLWIALKAKFHPMITIAVVGLLALFDIIGVNKRYLSNDQFQFDRQANAVIEPMPADKEILKDKDLNYRVLDLGRGNPFSNAITSYFHKSLGGYHAAKLRLFQDVFMGKYDTTFLRKDIHLLNMMNTKYILTRGGQGNSGAVAIPNPDALGNAWFVQRFRIINNANEELDALGNFNPKEEALVQERFASGLSGFKIQYDSTNTIQLTNYIPDKLTYKYTAKTEQLAVFSEVYYPEKKGWQVYLDGNLQPNALLKIDYLLRGVRVPAGEHTLEMRFEPKSYYTGQTVAKAGSALLLILFGLGLFFTFGKNREEFVDDVLSSQTQLKAEERPEQPIFMPDKKTNATNEPLPNKAPRKKK